MPKKKEPSSPDERRDAASKRARGTSTNPLVPLPPLESQAGIYGMSVTNFSGPRTRSSTRQAVTIPTVRVTEDLGRRIGAFSTEHSLSMSETVRVLLEAGLNELEGDEQP